MAEPVKAMLFDKDGTLFDFEETWNAWAKAMLVDLSGGNVERSIELGAAIGFDFANGKFDLNSSTIAGTPDDIAENLLPLLPGRDFNDLVIEINNKAAKAPQAETVPLKPFIQKMRELGVKIGVATNDAEMPARAHLASVGVERSFDFIAGYDSGFGGKPEPGMCLAFAEAMGVDPDHCVMVGDSTHDLFAGRAAGMRTIAVLTGMAGHSDLAPFATVVLPNIGYIPEWIDSLN